MWVADIRKTALVAGIVTVAGSVLPLWSLTAVLLASAAAHPFTRWPGVVIIASIMFAATLPLFCFALYREHETFSISKHLRLMSLGAALVLCLMTVGDLTTWAGSIGARAAGSVLSAASGSWRLSDVTSLASALGGIAYSLLLIAIYRHMDDGSTSDAPPSGLLRFATRAAVIAWCIRLGIIVIQAILSVVGYIQYRNLIPQYHMSLMPALVRSLRMLIGQACYIVAPYVIYKARVRSVRPGSAMK